MARTFGGREPDSVACILAFIDHFVFGHSGSSSYLYISRRLFFLAVSTGTGCATDVLTATVRHSWYTGPLHLLSEAMRDTAGSYVMGSAAAEKARKHRKKARKGWHGTETAASHTNPLDL